MLQIHYGFAFLVVLTALWAIVDARGRRLVQYLLVVQIVLGALVWWTTKAPPPPAHWILALLVGGVYPLASALERRGRPRAAIVGIGIVGAAVIAYIFSLGMHAVRG